MEILKDKAAIDDFVNRLNNGDPRAAALANSSAPLKLATGKNGGNLLILSAEGEEKEVEASIKSYNSKFEIDQIYSEGEKEESETKDFVTPSPDEVQPEVIDKKQAKADNKQAKALQKADADAKRKADQEYVANMDKQQEIKSSGMTLSEILNI